MNKIKQFFTFINSLLVAMILLIILCILCKHLDIQESYAKEAYAKQRAAEYLALASQAKHSYTQTMLKVEEQKLINFLNEYKGE